MKRHPLFPTLAAVFAVNISGCAAPIPDLETGAVTPPATTATRDASTPTPTPTEEAATSPTEEAAAEEAAGEYKDIPPGYFLNLHNQEIVSFDTPIAGVNYFCTLGDAGVACTATAPEDVPNLEDMPGTPWGPFTGRPGAVFLDHQGEYSWGVLEGFPHTNPDAHLDPGERVEFKGGWCQVPNPDTIECGAGGGAFSVTGPDRTFSPL